VRLLFQPAEEGGAGASHMIKEGSLCDAEAIFAMHIDCGIPTGSIASISGPVLAAACVFEAKIVGKYGNVGNPHTSLDPILAASFSILALQLLISKETNPLDSQVCPYPQSFHVIFLKGSPTLKAMAMCLVMVNLIFWVGCFNKCCSFHSDPLYYLYNFKF
jgi:hypothetical protein